MKRYPVPKHRVRVEHRVSNSRFIATVGPAATVDAAKAFLREIREEMPDATHHVYAMRVGYGASVIEGMSDDGEPSGTSGPPTLAVLRGADLGDVVLVISRYFGGTKLGTGGLVAAYSAAAKLALEALETEPRVIRIDAEMVVSYPLYERARRLLESHEGRIVREQFGETVHLDIEIPEENLEAFAQEMKGISSGHVEVKRQSRAEG